MSATTFYLALALAAALLPVAGPSVPFFRRAPPEPFNGVRHRIGVVGLVSDVWASIASVQDLPGPTPADRVMNTRGEERLLVDVGDPRLEPVKVVASPGVTHIKFRVAGLGGQRDA